MKNSNQKNKFKTVCNKVMKSSDGSVTSSLQVDLKILATEGIVPRTYNARVWKTTWKSFDVIGLRLIASNSHRVGIDGPSGQYKQSDFKKNFSEIRRKMNNLVSGISNAHKILQKHVDIQHYQNLDNDSAAIKEEIDNLSWVNILVNNILLNDGVIDDKSIKCQSFDPKKGIVDVGEHASTHCMKYDNNLEISFKDDFPSLIQSYYDTIKNMVFSFIMLFNGMIKNADINLYCYSEDLQTNDIIFLRFRVTMKRPKAEPPSVDLLDKFVQNPNMENQNDFLTKSLNKYLSLLGAKLVTEQGTCSKNNFEVIFYEFCLF